MPPVLSQCDVTSIFRAKVRAGLLAAMSFLFSAPYLSLCGYLRTFFLLPRATAPYLGLTFEVIVEPLDPRLPISVVVSLAEVNQSALDV